MTSSKAVWGLAAVMLLTVVVVGVSSNGGVGDTFGQARFASDEQLVATADRLMGRLAEGGDMGAPVTLDGMMCEGNLENVSAITGYQRTGTTFDDVGVTVTYDVDFAKGEGDGRVRVSDRSPPCVAWFEVSATLSGHE